MAIAHLLNLPALTTCPPRCHPRTMADHSESEPRGKSCAVCRRRKVRCDKKIPCTPCTRGGRACVYPQPGPAPRRARKTTMNDVASRISELEKTVTVVSRARDAYPTVTSGTSPYPPTSSNDDLVQRVESGTEYSSPNGEVLLRNGSSSQYFNEVFLSQVIDQACVLSSHNVGA